MLYLTPISTFFQPTILCWAQTHILANCNLCSSIHVLHWNLSTTTTTCLYFHTHSMVVYILAYMVPSFKVAYPSSWTHFSQTRSRPASYFSITTITASREKFESEVKYWAALITRSANMLMTGAMEVLLEDNRREEMPIWTITPQRRIDCQDKSETLWQINTSTPHPWP